MENKMSLTSKISAIIDENIYYDDLELLAGIYDSAEAIVEFLPLMVLPLNWEVVITGTHYSGNYALEKFDEGYLVDFNDQTLDCGLSLEEAKAVAQAHYTEEVMEAFGITL